MPYTYRSLVNTLLLCVWSKSCVETPAIESSGVPGGVFDPTEKRVITKLAAV